MLPGPWEESHLENASTMHNFFFISLLNNTQYWPTLITARVAAHAAHPDPELPLLAAWALRPHDITLY